MKRGVLLAIIILFSVIPLVSASGVEICGVQYNCKLQSDGICPRDYGDNSCDGTKDPDCGTTSSSTTCSSTNCASCTSSTCPSTQGCKWLNNACTTKVCSDYTTSTCPTTQGCVVSGSSCVSAAPSSTTGCQITQIYWTTSQTGTIQLSTASIGQDVFEKAVGNSACKNIQTKHITKKDGSAVSTISHSFSNDASPYTWLRYTIPSSGSYNFEIQPLSTSSQIGGSTNSPALTVSPGYQLPSGQTCQATILWTSSLTSSSAVTSTRPSTTIYPTILGNAACGAYGVNIQLKSKTATTWSTVTTPQSWIYTRFRQNTGGGVRADQTWTSTLQNNIDPTYYIIQTTFYDAQTIMPVYTVQKYDTNSQLTVTSSSTTTQTCSSTSCSSCSTQSTCTAQSSCKWLNNACTAKVCSDYTTSSTCPSTCTWTNNSCRTSTSTSTTCSNSNCAACSSQSICNAQTNCEFVSNVCRSKTAAQTIQDEDKDGVDDTLDQCPLTPLGETVDSTGCSILQLSCITQWNCPDFNTCTNGIKSRDIGDCSDIVNNPTACKCDISGVTKECRDRALVSASYRPSSSLSCKETEAFSFFSWINGIAVISLLVLYYLFQKGVFKKNKKRKRVKVH